MSLGAARETASKHGAHTQWPQSRLVGTQGEGGTAKGSLQEGQSRLIDEVSASRGAGGDSDDMMGQSAYHRFFTVFRGRSH